MSPQTTTACTDEIDAADRLEFWESYNARELVGLRCSTYSPEGLRAHQINVDLGDLRLAALDCSAHVIDRSMQQVRSTPKGSILVSILLEGTAFFHHATGSRILRAGDALIYEADDPYLFGFDTEMRKHMLDIPRELCGTTVPRPVQISRGADVPAAGIRAISERVAEIVAGAQDSKPREELLAATMALFRPPESTAEVLCRTTKTLIDARLTDPELTADLVARTVGVSLRHLNRVLSSEGTTVSGYIYDRRLESARQELSEPLPTPPLIADIAARWGFSSQAHFTRSFRRRFGMPPSQLRNNARQSP